MLTPELNEKITRVGPDTPGGKLLRHYWLPIAGSAELKSKPTKRVRLLGEDLVLFKDKSGNLGLIDERCAARTTGGSTMPAATAWSSRPSRWAAPFDKLRAGPSKTRSRLRLTWDDTIRQIGITVLPCNWVQAMENSIDATHVEWLHGYYTNYLLERAAAETGELFRPRRHRHHVKLGFDRFEHGIIKRRVEEGGSEEDDDWKIGHPVVFPHILKTGSASASSFQIRVPMDDTHTLHILYRCYRPGIPVPKQEEVPVYQIPWQDERGEANVDFTLGQDMMAWVTQGDVAQRHLEKLGASDTGIILYRELLVEQIERVERGEEPIEVYRDPAKNQIVELPQERQKHGDPHWGRPTAARDAFLGAGDGLRRHMPTPDIVIELFQAAEELEAAGQRLTPDWAHTLDRATGRRREVVLKK